MGMRSCKQFTVSVSEKEESIFVFRGGLSDEVAE